MFCIIRAKIYNSVMTLYYYMSEMKEYIICAMAVLLLYLLKSFFVGIICQMYG